MVLLPALAACGPDPPGAPGPGPGPDATEPGPSPTEPLPEGLSGLGWRLHETQGSLVWAGWTQSDPGSVRIEYRFDPGEWLTTPTGTYEAGPHERLVVGIPYGTAAEWRGVLDDGEPVDGAPIVTGAVPEGLPVGTVTVADPARWDTGGRWFLGSINEREGGWTGGEYWTFVADRQGRVVWAQRAPGNAWTLFAQVSAQGDHLLWDEQHYWPFLGDPEEGRVHRTWLDAELAVVPTPGLHHAFVELPDGTIAWPSRSHGGGEALVERTPDGDEVVLWTCAEDWPGAAGCHSNGLFHDASTDRYLLSSFPEEAVVEIDRATGASTWWAGNVPGGYTFAPATAAFSWPHGVTRTPTGTLLLSSRWGSETAVVEYAVGGGELALVWSDGAGLEAETNGQAWRLANGNTLHVLGSASIVREVTPDHEEVWVLDFGGTRLLGQGELVADLYALTTP